jgi:DNA modification methylase
LGSLKKQGIPRVVMTRVGDLTPYARNARTHSDEQVAQIAASIKEFGWTNPILVDGEKGLIAGHGRLAAARKLGMEEVPVIELTHLTETQKKALILADNKLALNAGWDAELLNLELEELELEGVDLNLVGFGEEERDALRPEVVNEGLTDEDAVPETPEEPITKPGDIWILGKHRLMCGDSTSVDAVDRLMPETAHMVFTDPPYLMDFTGGIHADGSKSFNAKHGRIANDKMSEQEGDDFLDAINSIISSKCSGAFYITFYRLGIDRYYASMARTGLQCRALIIWDKGNHTLSNSDYMSMYEPMFYGWVSDHNFYGGNNGMDIWRIERTKKNDLHPTMKPMALVEKAICDGSKTKDIILDLFGGSGTTLIACEKTGRSCRMMEVDPKYCDVIVKRWEEFTGQKARLENAEEIST